MILQSSYCAIIYIYIYIHYIQQYELLYKANDTCTYRIRNIVCNSEIKNSILAKRNFEVMH